MRPIVGMPRDELIAEGRLCGVRTEMAAIDDELRKLRRLFFERARRGDEEEQAASLVNRLKPLFLEERSLKKKLRQ